MHSTIVKNLVTILVIGAIFHGPAFAQEKRPSAREVAYFEANIRPLLVQHCYECHSVESGANEGGLRVDSAAALLRGGETGPALVPGDPERSLLIHAVRHQKPAKAMPPEDAGEKLSDDEIDKLVKWIRAGAPDPRQDNSRGLEKKEEAEFYASLNSWWSYLPIKMPTIPEADPNYSEQTIDRFIRQSQMQLGVTPAPIATDDVLLRRVYYDLVGLPPSVDQAKQFNNDVRSLGLDKAYSNVVDELLRSEQYGMHWGRHWLDVARYAESTGREFNVAYPSAWRYRNWVIEAFNQDMPYDQFLTKQIAGDLLPTRNDAEKANNMIATGFLAIGSKSLNERNPKQFAVDQADEQIDATFQASMGLTFACARCHDHKFDPVSQRDYTAVAGIFLSTKTLFGTPSNGMQNRNGTILKSLPNQAAHVKLSSDINKDELAKKRSELVKLQSELKTAQRELFTARRKDEEIDQSKQRQLRQMQLEVAMLEQEVSNYSSDGKALALAMAVEDQPASSVRAPRFAAANRGKRDSVGFVSITDSPFFARGELELAGESVPRSVPEMFGKSKRFEIPEDSSGRLQLARWITDDHNPMTARVAANRVWTWIFDEPIVDSVDNFGTSGSKPRHPELLDYLALQLRGNHWSQKQLIREIVLSRTYRASAHMDEGNMQKDPDNTTLWRANLKRLPAEAIRDSMLSTAKLLDTKVRMGSEIAQRGDGIVRLNVAAERTKRKGPMAKFAGAANQPSTPPVRSVFLGFPRDESFEIFDLFDAPDGSVVQGRRDTTNVPTQSLYLLNNAEVQTYCLATAKSLLSDTGKDASSEAKVGLLFQRILCRKPTDAELNNAEALISNLGGDEAQAYASLAKALFATAEFRYVE